MQHKVAAYLFFITKPKLAILNLWELETYSSFKINLIKLKASNINLLISTHLNFIRVNFPFKWVNDEFKYLGVYFTSTIEGVLKENVHPCLSMIQLQRWQLLICGLEGISFLNVLWLLYLLQIQSLFYTPSSEWWNANSKICAQTNPPELILWSSAYWNTERRYWSPQSITIP